MNTKSMQKLFPNMVVCPVPNKARTFNSKTLAIISPVNATALNYYIYSIKRSHPLSTAVHSSQEL